MYCVNRAERNEGACSLGNLMLDPSQMAQFRFYLVWKE